jgi:hypothetical protein
MSPEVKAVALYLSAWLLGIVGVLVGMVLLMWLLTPPPTDPGMFDDVYCLDRPREPVSDSDVQAWIDSGGEYQRPGGYQCYPNR